MKVNSSNNTNTGQAQLSEQEIMLNGLKSLSQDEKVDFYKAMKGSPIDAPYLKSIADKIPSDALQLFNKYRVRSPEMQLKEQPSPFTPEESTALKGIIAKPTQDLSGSDLVQLVKGGYKAAGSPGEGAIKAIEESYGNYVTGPWRAGQKEFFKGFTGNPLTLNPMKGLGAAIEQFGEDSRSAPTNEEFSLKMGTTKQKNIDLKNPYFEDLAQRFYGKKMPDEFYKTSSSALLTTGLNLVNDPLAIASVGTWLKLAKKGGGVGLRAADELANIAGLETQGIKNFAEGVGKYVGNKKELVSEFLFPKPAANWEELQAIKEARGYENINDLSKYNRNSLLTLVKKARNEGLASQPAMMKYDAGVKEVNDDLFNTIASKSGGDILSPADMGQKIKTDFFAKRKELLDQMDVTYSTVVNQLPPGTRLIDVAPEAQSQLAKSLAEIKTPFKRDLAVFAPNSDEVRQAKKMIGLIDHLEKSQGDLSHLVDQMRSVGDKAFTDYNVLQKIPSEIKAKKEIYFALRNSIIDATKNTLGKDVADQLVANNKLMSDYFSASDGIGSIIQDSKVGTEQIYNSLFKSGDTKKLQDLKKVVSPETMNAGTATLLDSYIAPSTEEKVSFENFYKKLDLQKDKLRVLLTPEELANFVDISRYGASYNMPVISTSKTSSGIALKNIPINMAGALVDDQIIKAFEEAINKRAFAKQPSVLSPGELNQKRIPWLIFKGGEQLNIQEQRDKDNALIRRLQNQ